MCTGNQCFTVTAVVAVSLAELSWAVLSCWDLAGAQSRFSQDWRGGGLLLQETQSFPTGPWLRITVCTQVDMHMYCIYTHVSVISINDKHTDTIYKLTLTDFYCSVSLLISTHTSSPDPPFVQCFPGLSELLHLLSSPFPFLCQVFCRHPVAGHTTGPLFSSPCRKLLGSSHMPTSFFCVSLVSPSLLSPPLLISLSESSSGALLLFLILLRVVSGGSSPVNPQSKASYSAALSSKDNSARPRHFDIQSIWEQVNTISWGVQ